MTNKIAIGLGRMEFPFADAAGYWRWVDLCEAGGIDSIWQTDRLVSKAPILECMTTMAALAGRTRRLKFGDERGVAGAARSGAARQAMRHDRRAVGGTAAAGFRHRQSARAGMEGAGHRHEDARPTHRRGAGDHPPAVDARRASISTGKHYAARRLDLAASRCRPICRCGSAAASAAAIRRTAQVRHRLAGRRRDAGGGWRHRRRDQGRVGGGRPHHRRGPLWRGVSVSLRHAPTIRRWRRDGGVSQAHGQRVRRRISPSATPRRSSPASRNTSPPASKFILRPVARAATRRWRRRAADRGGAAGVAARWPKPAKALQVAQ